MPRLHISSIMIVFSLLIFISLNHDMNIEAQINTSDIEDDNVNRSTLNVSNDNETLSVDKSNVTIQIEDGKISQHRR
ncbi:MAG: hypothetical protein ACPKPY_00190 [Nitrososphaeraceae archaeon]